MQEKQNAMLKTKSGRLIQMPTAEEEATINTGIATDPENPEWTAEMFANTRPANEFFSPQTYTALINALDK